MALEDNIALSLMMSNNISAEAQIRTEKMFMIEAHLQIHFTSCEVTCTVTVTLVPTKPLRTDDRLSATESTLILQLCDTLEVKKKKKPPVPFEPWMHTQRGRATESEQAWVMMNWSMRGEKRAGEKSQNGLAGLDSS